MEIKVREMILDKRRIGEQQKRKKEASKKSGHGQVMGRTMLFSHRHELQSPGKRVSVTASLEQVQPRT